MNPTWMQTGAHSEDVVGLDLRAVSADDIDWKQLARALSRIPRYGGHGRVAVSVAEHSARLADWMLATGERSDVALLALMHDAHEAYTGDITTPMQMAIEAIDPDALAVVKAVGRSVQRIIEVRAGLEPTEAERVLVKVADLRIMQDERQMLFHARKPAWGIDHEGLAPLGVAFSGWASATGEREWLRRMHYLQARR